MIGNIVTLALALGASAEVPHWMVSKVHQRTAEKMMAPLRSLQSKYSFEQTGNARRTQAIMSSECEAACPGAKDFVMEMMKAATQETTPPPAGSDPMVSLMMGMCDKIDTIVCVGTEKACIDEGEGKEEDSPEAMKCLCKCPKLMSASSAMGEGNFAPMCDNKADTLGCMSGESTCAALAEDADPAQMNVMCDMHTNGCIEKAGTCKESEDSQKYDSECEAVSADKSKLAAVADTCCPLGKSLVDCYGAACMKLIVASMEFETDKPEETVKFKNLRETCPDAGLPSEAEVKATIAGASGGGSGGSDGEAAGSASGLAASMVAIIATMVALFA